MTVRANKPAFSIREKLKELDYSHVPYDKMPAGSVIQVVEGFAIAQVESSYASETSLGLSASISPKFSNSKILVMVNLTGCGSRDENTYWRSILKRDSTNIASFNNYTGSKFISGGEQYPSGMYLDSPNTTSSITYAMYGLRVGGTVNCYAIHNDSGSPRQRATIVLMEISQ